MTAEQKFALWLAEVPQDTDIGRELSTLRGNTQEIQSRFGGNLTFGTAGLRGIMGAGTDRMNVYTVRRAALAYGQYIKAADLPDTCAVAYDTRNHSREFAEVCAVALAEEGIHVYFYPQSAPTPMLSFAVRQLKTGGGVVMTASHNPAAYNGMKCYGSDGCQQTDEPAAEVFRRMLEVPMLSRGTENFETLLERGSIELLDESIYESYYAAVLGEGLCAPLIPVSGLRVLYTPLHGTGLTPVTTLLDRLQVNYDVVEAQAAPNGDFPTCPYPNPETAAAFDEVIKQLSAPGAPEYDLVLATDPDSDRMAAAVPERDKGGKLRLHRFAGNEFGCLLLEYILNNRLRRNDLPGEAKCIKSIVTTPMVRNIASRYGCQTIDVLTGFKYIGSAILELERQGKAAQEVFAFEESCGFLKGTYVRDKDAQVACMLAVELAAACKLEGISLKDKMERLYESYGYYKTQVLSVELDGETGKRRCADFMDTLREKPFQAVASMETVGIDDYRERVSTDCQTGNQTVLDFPKSNVLSFRLAGGSQVIFRPSGTEPKLKVYYFAVADREPEAQRLLRAMTGEVAQTMERLGVV